MVRARAVIPFGLLYCIAITFSSVCSGLYLEAAALVTVHMMLLVDFVSPEKSIFGYFPIWPSTVSL